MRLGLMNTALGDGVLEEHFQRASAVGAEGLEISYPAPYGAKVLGEDGHAEQLKSLAQKHNVAIPSLGLSFLCDAPSLVGPAKMADQSRKQIVRALDLAAAIGAKVVLVPFFRKNSIQLEPELSRAADALLPLVEQAEERGVIVALETTINMDQTRFLLDFLGNSDFARSYYDVGNVMARKFDPATGIRELGKSIAQVHFKDVKLSEAAAPDFNVPLGGGNVDLRACVNALRAIDYDGWIVLETPPGADPLTSASANLAFMGNILKE